MLFGQLNEACLSGRFDRAIDALSLSPRAIHCLIRRIAYKPVFLNRSEFPTTDRELRLIATLAQTGEISKAKKG